jgi:diguanylate cyclase (GGDEF)-like protein
VGGGVVRQRARPDRLLRHRTRTPNALTATTLSGSSADSAGTPTWGFGGQTMEVARRTVDKKGVEVRDNRMMLLSAAAIYAGAALLGLSEGLLPGGEHGVSPAPSAVALLVCLVLVVGGKRLPPLCIFLLGPLGAALIGVAVATTADYGDGAVLYMWPAIWASYFFGTRGTVFIVAWIGAVHAAALVALPPGHASLDRWLDVEMAVVVVAVVVRVLAVRNERLLAQMAEEARVDPLTGLLNRRGFDERLDVERSRSERDAAWLSAIRFDLDHFKRVNDEHGHDMGDRVLAWLGGMITEQIRGVDVAARVGGEEFVVVLPRADGHAARAFAERVRHLVESPGRDTGRDRYRLPADLALSISAGIAAAIAPSDVDALLQDADRALYSAKEGGRNRVVVDGDHRDGAVPSVRPAKGRRLTDGDRLAALHTTGILDAAPEASLERLNVLAGQLLGVPVSLVSLVDANRQVFAAQSGLPEPWASYGETPLSHSFCQHVVERDAPLIVADTRTDPALRHNLAIRDINVIAYAGVPVHAPNGQPLGALCAIDGAPREWTDRDLRVLRDLARVASDLIDLHGRRRATPLRDVLTGLPDRRLFSELVSRSLERASRTVGGPAVLAIGLDGFRLINEALGHAGGDQILIAVAGRLSAALRDGDALCRLGGDEFLVLCESVHDEAEALAISRRLRTAVCGEACPVDGGQQAVAATVGIATAPGAGSAPADAQQLIQAAITSLAHAKSGATAVERPDPAHRDRASLALAIHDEIGGAHLRDELEVVYQPLVHLPSGRLHGFEALVRWNHPTLGAISPADFIPAAEATGAIVALGEWVLQRACADLARWRVAAPDGEALTVSVNVAAAQLGVANLDQVVTAALTRSGLPADALMLELTERTLIDERPVHLRTLEALAAVGVALSIDDFGTGYSSLGYLSRFPISQLKLDRQFVTTLDHERARRFLAAIVAMAETLDIRVVAEGIETDTQLDLVKRLGCDLGQGYLLGPPASADATTERLAQIGRSATSVAGRR